MGVMTVSLVFVILLISLLCNYILFIVSSCGFVPAPYKQGCLQWPESCNNDYGQIQMYYFQDFLQETNINFKRSSFHAFCFLTDILSQICIREFSFERSIFHSLVVTETRIHLIPWFLYLTFPLGKHIVWRLQCTCDVYFTMCSFGGYVVKRP